MDQCGLMLINSNMENRRAKVGISIEDVDPIKSPKAQQKLLIVADIRLQNSEFKVGKEHPAIVHWFSHIQTDRAYPFKF